MKKGSKACRHAGSRLRQSLIQDLATLQGIVNSASVDERNSRSHSEKDPKVFLQDLRFKLDTLRRSSKSEPAEAYEDLVAVPRSWWDRNEADWRVGLPARHGR